MEQLITFLADNGQIVILVAVFFAVTFVTFAIANLTTSWSDVRRRAMSEAEVAGPAGVSTIMLSGSQPDYLKNFMPTDEVKKAELIKFLNSAGYYGTGAVIRFQAIRFLCAFAFGILAVSWFGKLYPDKPFFLALAAGAGLAAAGYMLPRSIVSMRRDGLFEEHRHGFPDFLDLLVICVEAGIGIDAAVDRVGRDLAQDYPSLGRNLAFMSLELRAGKSTREALDNLSSRLGIPEARSFATLVQQSEELGTSLVQSLRVYSDEMRQKRLARAEEKAHALPVKLVLPLALFIFPVILGVTLMPVAMKLYKALGI